MSSKHCGVIVGATLILVGFLVLIFHSIPVLGIFSVFAQSINGNAEPSSFLPFFGSAPEYGSPSAIKGFHLYDGTLFQVSYPSNWTKEAIPFVRYTGIQSVPEVAFYVPNENVQVILSTERPGNVILSDYVSREVASLQDSLANFKLINSGQSRLGNITAQKILYTSGLHEDGIVYGKSQTMELISVDRGVSYFFVYKAEASAYSNYLPVILEMIKSFEVKNSST
ncbi:MAG: hypothetical protein WAM88_04865 [Nitrososphaeraceae archaeon]